MATNNAINTPLVIGVTRGGTGAATLTSHGVLLGAGTSAVTATAELSNGQLLIGSTGNVPSAASLTAGSNITITPGAGSITIASTAGSDTYTVITADQTVVAYDQYIVNGSGTLTLTLPSDLAAAVGSTFAITTGTQQWILAQQSGDSVRLGSSVSTTGTGGSLASSAVGDSIKLVKKAANSWQVVDVVGNITVV